MSDEISFRPLVDVGMPGSECTFAMIKSAAVREEATGAILVRILGEGFTIAAARKVELSGIQIAALYQDHVRKPYWPDIVTSVAGDVVIMILAGKNAVMGWREIMGATDSSKAEPSTLRHEFGSRTTLADNVVHGSDSRQAADREIRLFFPQAISLLNAEE